METCFLISETASELALAQGTEIGEGGDTLFISLRYLSLSFPELLPYLHPSNSECGKLLYRVVLNFDFYQHSQVYPCWPPSASWSLN